MNQVAQNYRQDLQKSQILFILGGPGIEMGTQCERLVRDFKFEHVAIDDILKEEIKNQSKEGLSIQDYVDKGLIAPTELTVGLLLKCLSSKRAKRILVQGFPRSLEQASYFEQIFREIQLIINVVVPEEVQLERLNRISTSNIRREYQQESISNRMNVYRESTTQVIEMYSQLGKVAYVNGLGEVDTMYQQIKQAILPNLIFFYGAPSTGKTQVAQSICKHTSYRYLNLQDFFTMNKCSSNVDKINKLMNFFSESLDRNYVIDSFLDNKAQAVVFFEHFGKPRNVFYFQSSKDEIENNIREYSSSEADRSQRLAELQTFLNYRSDLVSFLQQFPFFKLINAVKKNDLIMQIDSLSNITQKVFEHIRPKVLIALTQNNPELAEGYIKRLEKEDGFIHLQVDKLCQEEVARQTPLGKQISAFTLSGYDPPAAIQSELIRKIIFQNPLNQRFILTNLPERQEFQDFGDNLFPMDGLFNFLKPDQKLAYFDRLNLDLSFIAENNHLIISSDDLGVARSFLTQRKSFGLVVGPSASGKTTLTKYIGLKFEYTVIEWESTIPILKEKLGPPGEPLEEVPLSRLVQYYQSMFAIQSSDKFVFDGFPPGCESTQQMDQFLEIGQPTWILSTTIVKEQLWKRFKMKSELDAAQELSPDDDDKMTLMMQVGDQNSSYLNEYVMNQSDCKLYQLDVNNSLDFTLQALDYIYQKRIFLARSLLQTYTPQQIQDFRIVFINVAAQNDMTFVDVEALLSQHQLDTSQEFGMRQTNFPVEFPSNYTPTLVVKLIQSYLQGLPTDKRDVLIWGYPSADHSVENTYEESLFPRVTDEIVCIEKHLGPIRIVYVITEVHMNSTIQDPEWELVKPVEKPKKIVDEDDPQDQPPEEDEVIKPKLNLYECKWTRSDGCPKNIAQIYTQLKQPQAESLEVSHGNYKKIFDGFTDFLQVIEEDLNANFFIQIQVQKH